MLVPCLKCVVQLSKPRGFGQTASGRVCCLSKFCNASACFARHDLPFPEPFRCLLLRGWPKGSHLAQKIIKATFKFHSFQRHLTAVAVHGRVHLKWGRTSSYHRCHLDLFGGADWRLDTYFIGMDAHLVPDHCCARTSWVFQPGHAQAHVKLII